MKKLIIVFGIFVIGILSSNKIVKDEPMVRESYTDYVDALTYLEQEIKIEREKGNLIPYTGEWKELFDRVEELYNIALDDSKSGPYMMPPALPKVCWFCQCLSWFCGMFNQCGCVYSINCQSNCIWCGSPNVLGWTNGWSCVTPWDCSAPCRN